MKRAVCIISGGMDSTVSAFKTKKEGYEIIAVHFNYGQRTEAKELKCFHSIIKDLNPAKEYVIDLPFFTTIGGSSLTDKNLEVRKSGVEEGVPNSYVPFRNGIFLSIAASIAEKEEAAAIVIGAVEEDSSGYPDCTKKFLDSFLESINLGTKKETKIELLAPLIKMTKEEIVSFAHQGSIDLSNTWSCYEREDSACGVCDSCRLRLKGFQLAELKDPIKYV